MKNWIVAGLVALMAVSFFASVDAEARGRKGSHRVGGHGSHGKGSHYVGGR
ncbi:hypothetical protein [Methylobacterium sp. J-068]|uniref:hypothetical protein n=1 Tax=Methylobacterium sp. J-068 TaxID=2836649 RepID=UPI001FBBDF8E|nr:hypothetical protein [Methylobacterium sp. J-068]MCJ2036402.1 hypothetical protein [Methylobacterium sp. J-068]